MDCLIHRVKQSILFHLNLTVFSASVISYTFSSWIVLWGWVYRASVRVHMCGWETQSLWVPHTCIFNLRLFFTSHFLFSDSPVPAFIVLNFLSCLVFFFPLCLKWMLTLFIFLQTCQQFTRKAIWFWGLCVCVKHFYYQSNLQL